MFSKVSLGAGNNVAKKIAGSRILLPADDVSKPRRKSGGGGCTDSVLSTRECAANAAEVEACCRNQAAAKKVAEVAALVSENKNVRLTRLLLSEAEARRREQAEEKKAATERQCQKEAGHKAKARSAAQRRR